jgi:cob(I)alamin adenosyltransferase
MSTKIYTKRGDTGETDLYGAGRVTKDDPRVEAYGTVDECNSALGIARQQLAKDTRLRPIETIVARLQNEMFCVGSELAAPGMIDKMPIVQDEHVLALEKEIDAFTADLPVLKHFILPGGSEAAATLHHARTISRRAERLTVCLVREHGVRNDVLTYLNRLSDHLFVLARAANHKLGVAETEWIGRT